MKFSFFVLLFYEPKFFIVIREFYLETFFEYNFLELALERKARIDFWIFTTEKT